MAHTTLHVYATNLPSLPDSLQMIALAMLHGAKPEAACNHLRRGLQSYNVLNGLGRCGKEEIAVLSIDAIRSVELFCERGGMLQPSAKHLRLLREELLHEIFDTLHNRLTFRLSDRIIV